jgi:hypothetical protein
MPIQLMIIVAVLIGSAGSADPLVLSCSGEIRGSADTAQAPENYSLPILIYEQDKSIQVGNYEPLPLSANREDNRIVFQAKPGSTVGLSSGTLDRVTGAASIHIIPIDGGPLDFEGICTPAKRLL